MATKIRVTHRTDTRGTVNADLRGLYEVQALDAALQAGIPGNLLHPAGWDGNEDDLAGYFAELIYRIGEAPFTAPDTIERLSAAIDAMLTVCRSLNVDSRAAMAPVYDMARFKRQLYEAGGRRAAIVRGEDLPLAPDSSYVEGDWSAELLP